MREELGALIGVLGFLLSSFNLVKSYMDAQIVRSVLFAQRKQDAFRLIREGRVTYLNWRRKLQSLQTAADLIQLNDISPSITAGVFECNTLIEKLDSVRREINRFDAKSVSHAQMLRFIEQQLSEIEDSTDPQSIDATINEFYEPAAERLSLVKEALSRGVTKEQIAATSQ